MSVKLNFYFLKKKRQNIFKCFYDIKSGNTQTHKPGAFSALFLNSYLEVSIEKLDRTVSEVKKKMCESFFLEYGRLLKKSRG